MRADAKHYCENNVEWEALEKMGIISEIRPMLFDDPDKYQICYKWSEKPNVYINGHPNRENEYGIGLVTEMAHLIPDVNFHIYGITKPELWFDSSIKEMRNIYYHLPNLIYHGHVSEKQFNEEIKNYQAGLRLNEFDGFGEILAKSILMGQYPITKIFYLGIDRASSREWLIRYLEALKGKMEPYELASNYWRKTLKENKEEVINNWNL